MQDNETSPPPTKAAKVLAVAGFFMLLFFIASVVGLPLPVGIVFAFFVSVALPIALAIALLATASFRLMVRLTGRGAELPLFDMALQTFIVLALLATGIFTARFPSWLQDSYPAVRAEIENQMTPDHTSAQRDDFLRALDRFWDWNVGFLLQEGTPPSEVAQQNVRSAITRFGEAMEPECDTCSPQLTVPETQELVSLMTAVVAPSSLTDATTANVPEKADSGTAGPAAFTGAVTSALPATEPAQAP